MLNKIFLDLEKKGRELLAREGKTESDIVLKRYVDLRYCGQVFEITIDVPLNALDESDLSAILGAFEAKYDNTYGKGTGWKEAGIELINFRLDSIGKMPKPTLKKSPLVGRDPKVARKGARPCYFPNAEGFISTHIYDNDALPTGMIIKGPTVVEMRSTSAVVGPNQEVYVDEYRNIIIRRC